MFNAGKWFVITSIFVCSSMFVITNAIAGEIGSSFKNNSDDYSTKRSSSFPVGLIDIFNTYKTLPTYKAFAIAVNSYGDSVAGWSYQYGSQLNANTAALRSCESDRITYKISPACTVYAEGNTVINLTPGTAATDTASDSTTLQTCSYDSITGTSSSCTELSPANEINRNMADSLFDSAENKYPQLFSPANQTSQTFEQWYYRYYPDTNSYVGVNNNDEVWVLGDNFGGLKFISPLQSVLEQMKAAILYSTIDVHSISSYKSITLFPDGTNIISQLYRNGYSGIPSTNFGAFNNYIIITSKDFGKIYLDYDQYYKQLQTLRYYDNKNRPRFEVSFYESGNIKTLVSRTYITEINEVYNQEYEKPVIVNANFQDSELQTKKRESMYSFLDDVDDNACVNDEFSIDCHKSKIVDVILNNPVVNILQKTGDLYFEQKDTINTAITDLKDKYEDLIDKIKPFISNNSEIVEEKTDQALDSLILDEYKKYRNDIDDGKIDESYYRLQTELITKARECSAGETKTTQCSLTNGYGTLLQSCTSNYSWSGADVEDCQLSSCNSGYTQSGNQCIAYVSTEPSTSNPTNNSNYPSDFIGSYTRTYNAGITVTHSFNSDYTGATTIDPHNSFTAPSISEFTWSYNSGKVTVNDGRTGYFTFDGSNLISKGTLSDLVFTKDGGSGLAGNLPYSLSCNDNNTQQCVDYSFSSLTDKNNFESQCKSVGYIDVITSCSQVGTGCKQTSSGRQSVTWSYGRPDSEVKSDCISNYGELVY